LQELGWKRDHGTKRKIPYVSYQKEEKKTQWDISHL